MIITGILCGKFKTKMINAFHILNVNEKCEKAAVNFNNTDFSIIKEA